MLHSKKIRDQKGAAITGLVIALMFFILIAGLFCFDASRVQMAQRELTATCDASALSGTAMLTSYDVSNDPTYTKLQTAQQNAAGFAWNMFNMGNILGRPVVNNTQLVTNLAQLATTTDGEAKVVIGLVDPKNSYQVVDPTPPNNANGRAIAVFAGYGYHPIFISFYGVGNVGILASSIGGLPQVDAVLVFDYSGSMDDLTQVTLIKRWWNPTPVNGYQGNDPDRRRWTVDEQDIEDFYGGNIDVPGLIAGNNSGCIQYDEAPHPLQNNQSILEYVDLDTANNLQGTSLNALPPQNLANSEAGTLLTGDNIIVFKRYLRHAQEDNDYDTPPGNCPAFTRSGSIYTKIIANSFTNFTDAETSHNEYPVYSGRSGFSSTPNAANLYTDLVVNIFNVGNTNYPPVQPIFGPAQFAPFNFRFPSTEDNIVIRNRTFRFRNIGAVVEAARGNRESNGNINGTGLHRGYVVNAAGEVNQYHPPEGNLFYPSDMRRRAGYQLAYQRLAMLCSQPIAGALDGADQGFFQKLSALADCRFGLVGFSDSDPFGGAPNLRSMATPHTGVIGGAVGTPAYSGKNSYYYDVVFSVGAPGARTWDGRFRSEHNGQGWPNAGGEVRRHENTANQQDAGGGQAGFRIPRAQLDTSLTQEESLNEVTNGTTQYPGPPPAKTSVQWSHPVFGNGLYNGRPLSGTMCAEALETARLAFQSGSYDGLSRAGSKRAIVFFTDGIPSGGVNSGEATASTAVATQCQSDGVAIYCIGLNMLGNPQLTADQDQFLGNGSGGLAGTAQNGSRYFETQDVQGIKDAFSAIARRLTQSQR